MPPILKKKVIEAYNCWFVCACVHAYVTFLSLLSLFKRAGKSLEISWIPHEKIANPYFSCPIYLLYQSISLGTNLKKNLVSQISKKVFELETWTADRG